MLEAPYTLWEAYRNGGTVVISTNGIVTDKGLAVMGAGVALAAKQHQPSLPWSLGKALLATGNHVYWFQDLRMFTFPTKDNWRDPSTLELIDQSAGELVNYLRAYPALMHVYMPKVGTKNGGLAWHDVEKVLHKHFVNDLRLRVLLVKPE